MKTVPPLNPRLTDSEHSTLRLGIVASKTTSLQTTNTKALSEIRITDFSARVTFTIVDLQLEKLGRTSELARN